MADGGLAILDYKPGSVPKPADVEAGRRTQLLTEAVIAAYGGFDVIAGDDIAAMQYWKLAGRRGEAGLIVDVMPDGWMLRPRTIIWRCWLPALMTPIWLMPAWTRQRGCPMRAMIIRAG